MRDRLLGILKVNERLLDQSRGWCWLALTWLRRFTAMSRVFSPVAASAWWEAAGSAMASARVASASGAPAAASSWISSLSPSKAQSLTTLSATSSSSSDSDSSGRLGDGGGVGGGSGCAKSSDSRRTCFTR